LPVPPGPVSVTSRPPATAAITAATSATRPTSEVSIHGSGTGDSLSPAGAGLGWLPGGPAGGWPGSPGGRAASGPPAHAPGGTACGGTPIKASRLRASACELTAPHPAKTVTIAVTSALVSTAPRACSLCESTSGCTPTRRASCC